MSGQFPVFLGWTRLLEKAMDKDCLQGHNTVTRPAVSLELATLPFQVKLRGQRFNSSARSYEWNLERTSNSPNSSCPVGWVLWDELLKEVILHITPLCSLLHILLKDGEYVCRTNENCKSLVLQDKCNIEIFLSPANSVLSHWAPPHSRLGLFLDAPCLLPETIIITPEMINEPAPSN